MMVRDYVALLAYIEARQSAPFKWGCRANDCVSFATGAVETMTGVKMKLPSWSSRAGARRVLRRMGGLVAAVDGALVRVPLSRAARGDVAVVDTGAGPVLMLVMGDYLLGPDFGGLRRLPRSRAAIAWSIG